MKKLVLYVVCLVLVSSGIGFAIYTHQQSVSQILQDPVYTHASIVNIEQTSKKKKGVSITSYDITYEYDVADTTYTGKFDVSETYFGKYKDLNEVMIGYLKTEPTRSQLKAELEKSQHIDWSEELLKIFLFCMVVSLVPYGLIGYMLGWVKAR